MPNPISRAFARFRRTSDERRAASRLAALPDYLLRDMGLVPGGEAALARQIRGEPER